VSRLLPARARARQLLSARRLSRRALLVGIILVVALGLRVGEVQRGGFRVIGDAPSYLALARQITQTGDYSTSRAPYSGAGGTHGPTTYFPPAFPYFLAFVDLVNGDTTQRPATVQPARLSQAVLGTITVGLIGLVALELFGPTVALIALGLAAVYPVLIELSATLVAENLLTALILASIWAALRAARSSRPLRWIAGSGLLAGLATLAHVNGIVVVIPLAWAAWRVRPQLTSPALLVAMTLLAISPWVVRDAIVLHRFVPVTDESGITLVGTYNAASAANRQIPYRWGVYFKIPGEAKVLGHVHRLTEIQLSQRLQSQAFHYISRHPLSPLQALYHNSRRLLELEGSTAWKTSAASIQIPIATARIGVLSFWLLCLLALAGAFTAFARRARRWLWLTPVLLWLSVALVNAETPRFREPVDPFLILLAACALASAAKAVALRVRGPRQFASRRSAQATAAAGPG
jgi:4-amino-4-deoxy-L-arabinose transferase-like glycosyltransferase